MIIRAYRPEDEWQWLQCRVLAFLDTPYYDHVLQHKEQYANSSIELVAIEEDRVVGLIDLELEAVAGEVCSNPGVQSAMIWHLAVHPDYRRKGIASQLLENAVKRLSVSVQRIEAWTREHATVEHWYCKQGFQQKSEYIQVFIEGVHELKGAVSSRIPKLYMVSAFAHYTGNDVDEMSNQFKRTYVTRQYELDVERYRGESDEDES